MWAGAGRRGISVPATMTLRTPVACASGGLSGGDIFLIIFFVSGFLYFSIGALIKLKRYNATGADLVPNIDFWRDLPHLVKDGFRFTYQKCCSK